jgi:UDP-N-acetyl-D-glucosamine dehydrogenase
MGIDIWEVIGAASSKPFGFMPFRPGPGVGGHCIPVDPRYLSWKAREYDFHTKFIEFAAEVNEEMPFHVVQLVTQGLNRQGKPLLGAEVLVLGVAFKPDIEDARNSPAERVIELLLRAGARVRYHDPYVAHFSVGQNPMLRQPLRLESVPLTAESVQASDVVVISAAHRVIDYDWVVRNAALVIDPVNATAGSPCADNIVRLGAPT